MGSTMLFDSLTVMFISVTSTSISEGISWALIYSQPQYQKLKAQIERTHKTLEKSKREVGIDAGGKRVARKQQKLEAELRKELRDLNAMKFRATFFLMFSMVAIFAVMNSIFEGVVVAKLPFEPFPLLRNVTHQGLLGDDSTDCAMTFMLMISAAAVRPNIQKILGFNLPRGINQMGMIQMPNDTVDMKES